MSADKYPSIFSRQMETIVYITSLLKNIIALNVKHIVLHLLTSLSVLNSLFNPLLYAVRIRYSLSCCRGKLSHKWISLKGIYLDQNKLIGDVVEQRENGLSREDELQQENETLGWKHSSVKTSAGSLIS